MNEYQYVPLGEAQKEIRLISLLPGTFNDEIRISIRHVLLVAPTDAPELAAEPGFEPSYPWTIDRTSDGKVLYLNKGTSETSWTDPTRPSIAEPPSEPKVQASLEPHYEALSYTWGTMDDPKPAYVQQSQSSKELATTIKIGQNLATAFRRLRHVDEVRTIWADAISINQKDVAERSTQVKRMADIYRLAYRVIAWMGEEDGDSEHALATIRYIGEQLVLTKSGRLFSSPGSEDPNMWRNASNFQFDDRTWKALLHFIERTWFYRLWCWQEINLSSTHSVFQCGQDQVGWPVLHRAILCLNNKGVLPSLMFRERCRHISYLTADAMYNPMSILLDLSRSKGCADPRDKVYGLLGLTAPSFSAAVRTDYALPVDAVYKDAFLTHLEATGRLELLKHCVLSRRRISGPSWVPDWSTTDFAAPILSEQFSTGISRAHFKHLSPDILEVTGLRSTVVQQVSSAAALDSAKALLAVSEWVQLLPASSVYTTGEDLIDAFALTIFMNRSRERHPTQHFHSVAELVGLVHDIIGLRPDSNQESLHSIREVGNLIQKIRGRVVFTTVDGYIGMAPDGVKAG
jgi:Heterokaryon incompatibility protein (HET)